MARRDLDPGVRFAVTPPRTDEAGCAPSVSDGGRAWRTPVARLGGRLVLAGLVLAAPAYAAASDPGGVLIEGGRASVRAGKIVMLRWTPLPPETEEFELLLSLDGGHQYLRLTEMQEPDLEFLEWRVPNLPTSDARLRLRVGIDGEEVELQPSAPFTILRDASGPLADITFRGGEWWTSRPLSVAEPDVPAPRQDAEAPIPPDWDGHIATSPGRDVVATRRPAAASAARGVRVGANPSDGPQTLRRSPRVIPLRE